MVNLEKGDRDGRPNTGRSAADPPSLSVWPQPSHIVGQRRARAYGSGIRVPGDLLVHRAAPRPVQSSSGRRCDRLKLRGKELTLAKFFSSQPPLLNHFEPLVVSLSTYPNSSS